MKIEQMIENLRPLNKGQYLVKYTNNTTTTFKYTDPHDDIAFFLAENARWVKKTYDIDVISIVKI